MSQIVLAGSTGYLGRYLYQQLRQDNHQVCALVRDINKAKRLQFHMNDLLHTDFNCAQNLHSQIPNCDVVISSLGITRQKDGFSYRDVDYDLNCKLLEYAKLANAKTFLYLAVLNGEHMKNRLCQAKEAFVNKLKNSGLDYRIIRPSGFFSDLQELAIQSETSYLPIFGDGSLCLNPIHGKDLARYCSQALGSPQREHPIGGPQVFTQKELMALLSNYPPQARKTIQIPDIVRRSLQFICRLLPEKIAGPGEFLLDALGRDMSAPTFGDIKLKRFLDHCHQDQLL